LFHKTAAIVEKLTLIFDFSNELTIDRNQKVTFNLNVIHESIFEILLFGIFFILDFGILFFEILGFGILFFGILFFEILILVFCFLGFY